MCERLRNNNAAQAQLGLLSGNVICAPAPVLLNNELVIPGSHSCGSSILSDKGRDAETWDDAIESWDDEWRAQSSEEDEPVLSIEDDPARYPRRLAYPGPDLVEADISSERTWNSRRVMIPRTPGEPGELPPEIKLMKRRRKERTLAAGITGGVVGFLVLGPIGGVAGGMASAYTTKVICKRREKRTMNKIVALNLEAELEGAPELKVHSPTAAYT